MSIREQSKRKSSKRARDFCIRPSIYACIRTVSQFSVAVSCALYAFSAQFWLDWWSDAEAQHPGQQPRSIGHLLHERRQPGENWVVASVLTDVVALSRSEQQLSCLTLVMPSKQRILMLDKVTSSVDRALEYIKGTETWPP